MSANTAPYYFVPGLSAWPILGALAMLFFIIGSVTFVNQIEWYPFAYIVSFSLLFYVLYRWFRDVVCESEGGKYNQRVDVSFRWSMGWFIFSEVMFFASFFGALFYAREFAMPWLGNLDHRAVLWPDFNAIWPHAGPAGTIDSFATMGPWPLPTINTALLLTSGVTLTIAHHALIANQRRKLIINLALTVLLGALFMGCQVYEYIHAYSDLNLKLTSGIYGSTFFMLTGFHGFHVTIGAIILLFILIRCTKGHFSAKNHFAFEAAAWYWHFVDVVWLLLYVVVYWL